MRSFLFRLTGIILFFSPEGEPGTCFLKEIYGSIYLNFGTVFAKIDENSTLFTGKWTSVNGKTKNIVFSSIE